MKQYDLNGFQGGLASIGAYFGIVFIFLIGIGTVYLQVYYYSIVIFILDGLLYYYSFTLGNRYRRIFFDEENFYFDNQTVSLKSIISINKNGIIKYDVKGKTKKVFFSSFPLPAENFEILKHYYNKTI